MRFVLAFILEASQYPSCLALLKTAILISFDRKNPTSSNVVSMWDLAKVDKVENIVLAPAVIFIFLCFGKLARVLAYVGGGSLLSCSVNFSGRASSESLLPFGHGLTIHKRSGEGSGVGENTGFP